MASPRINHLSKEENIYELYLRGVPLPTSSVDANVIRKLIRKALRDKLVPSVNNLIKKISLGEELTTVQSKVTYLENLYNEIAENKLPLKIIKFEAKYAHLKNRLDNISKVKLTAEQKSLVASLEVKANKINDSLLSIIESVDVSDLDKLEQSLNLYLTEAEDELADNVQVTLNSNPGTSQANIVQTNNDTNNTVGPMTATVSSNCLATVNRLQENYHSNFCVFNKLANPVEKYLQAFRVADGLDINELLYFLENLLKLKKQTNMSDSEILLLIQSYTVSPLLDEVLECISVDATVKQLHKQILLRFITVSLRERMKHELVFRPQLVGEPLSLYISEVRCYSEVLQCEIPELELVDSILCGINPEDRRKLVFEKSPRSFKDLDNLCIAIQNANYNDFMRTRNNQQPPIISQPYHNLPPNPNVNNDSFKYRPNTRNGQGPRFNQPPPKCYNCNRVGHLARNCYANKQ